MSRNLLFILLLLSSCSIHKRHFNNGYDIQWRGTYASSSNELPEEITQKSEPCDTIKNKDGSVILALVERIDSKKIYITPCENSDNKNNEVDRTIVSSIHYANGALFENKTPEQLQKEREENLEKYRTDKDAYQKELLVKEQQRLATENAALKAENDSLLSANTKMQNTQTPENSDSAAPKKFLPLMKIFFIIGFAIAGITFILTALSLAGDLAIGSLGVLFITDIVSLFVTVASLIKMNRNKGKYRGHILLPLLIEFLFGVVSVLAALYWVFMNF